jgi:hypothetical protein
MACYPQRIATRRNIACTRACRAAPSSNPGALQKTPSFRGGRLPANPESRRARHSTGQLWISCSRRRGAPRNDERVVFVTAPALQRTASQGLCAALRPGNGVCANCRSRTCDCIPYPPPFSRIYPARVLSDEGALLEAILKWDRARAGREGQPRRSMRRPRPCLASMDSGGLG